MSQLELDTIEDDAIGRGLRPEEDPWSSLAVSRDDVLGDHGIPSPVVGTLDAAAEEYDDDADPPVSRDTLPLAATPAHVVGRVDEARHDGGATWDAVGEEAEENDARPQPASVTAEPDDEAEFDDENTIVTMIDPAIEPTRGGAFTIPMVCAGIAIIACCLLIPQADANRRMAYQHVKLKADLEAVERQVAVNDEFLRKVSDDPNLAERLAQRQMKIIRPGTKVLALKGSGEAEMSPFQITAVAPPPQLPPYQPRGGTLAQACYNPKSRLYLLGIGLLLTAGGLVLGFGARSAD